MYVYWDFLCACDTERFYSLSAMSSFRREKCCGRLISWLQLREIETVWSWGTSCNGVPVCVCVYVEPLRNWLWCWWKAPWPPRWQWVIFCVSDSDVLTWPTGQAWLSALAYLVGTALVTSHPEVWSVTIVWDRWDRVSLRHFVMMWLS